MISALPVGSTGTRDTTPPDMPHVLLVLDQFPKALGGGERMVLRLAALLPKYGYRASILTFFVHPECSGLKALPCPVYVLPLERTYNVKALSAAFELRRFIKAEQIEIVQTFFESSDIWAGLVTKIMSGAKLISSRRDMGILRSRKHQIAYRLMSGIPDAVICVSEQVRKYCIEVDRIDPKRAHTIYNGLDLAQWNAGVKQIQSLGNNHVTTVGNIRRVKGHDLFIKAAALTVRHYPDTYFSIAGELLEEDYFVELQALVRELNLQKRFKFLGGVKDIHKHLSQADIFVLPSRSEGFSNAIVEAMAASLPVVATAVGGNEEAVDDGVTGLIVPPENAEALSAAVISLLSDLPRLTAMGNAGRKRAVDMFTTEMMMRRIVATYDAVLAGDISQRRQ